MLKRSLAGIVLLTLVLVVACSAEAAPASPGQTVATSVPAIITPSPVAALATEVAATATPISERSAIIDYLSLLTQFSNDYSTTLEDAQVIVVSVLGARGPHLRISGSAQTFETIYAGFSNRVDQASPGSLHPELAELHSVVKQLIERDTAWLRDYRAASEAGDLDTLSSMEFSYHEQETYAELDLIRDRIGEMLATHNIPASEVGYDPLELRLTIHNNDHQYLESGIIAPADQLTNELLTVQAALDLMIADLGLNSSSILPSSVDTREFFDIDIDGSTAGKQSLFPDYLRQNPTLCKYSWDSAGRVTQTTCR